MPELGNNEARSRKSKGYDEDCRRAAGRDCPLPARFRPRGGARRQCGFSWWWRVLRRRFHGPVFGGFHTPITLKVEAVTGLPGLNHSDLCRFLAAHMADARLADWRFEPADGDIAAPNRVEWTFRLNPYAGGEVRQFVREPVMEEGFGVHRPVTIESRLYLNDQYQTVVKQRALVQGGPNDPELAAAVASTTESLLGHSGAHRTCDWTRSSGRGCGEAMQ